MTGIYDNVLPSVMNILTDNIRRDDGDILWDGCEKAQDCNFFRRNEAPRSAGTGAFRESGAFDIR